MEFRKVSQEELHKLVRSGGYPGGTTKTSVIELEKYVTRKSLKELETNEKVRAKEAYACCSYSPSVDVKAAEDKLLDTCAVAQACPYNHHGRSNLPKGTRGLVYVLHE